MGDFEERLSNKRLCVGLSLLLTRYLVGILYFLNFSQQLRSHTYRKQ